MVSIHATPPGGELMPERPDYRTKRTAEYSARDLLTRYGYTVIRVAQSHSHESAGINLIAWDKDGDILFIYARSCRRVSFMKDVHALCRLVVLHRYPGALEYWIRCKAGWKRYLIRPGGAFPLQVLS